MTKVGAAIVAILVPTFLVGCAQDKPPLSNNTIASLLRADRAAHCDRQTIYIRAARFGQDYTDRAEKWFDNTLLKNDRFHQVSEQVDSTEKRGTLSYRDGADSFTITWSQYDLPFDPKSKRLDIAACIYVPKAVELINASFGRHSAQVLFFESLRLSLFGLMLRDAGLLRPNPIATASNGYEYVAELGQSGTGWRVVSVDVH